MSDLIRRQSAINAIENTDVPMSAKEWDELTDAIVSIPAVDAVEVVRCRECKHYKPSKFNSGTAHYCAVIDGFPVEEWYCAEGQRREDGDNGKHL